MRAASRLLTRVTPLARATAGGPSRPPPPRPASSSSLSSSSSSSSSSSRPQVVTRLTPEQVAAAQRAQEAQWSAPPERREQAPREEPQLELPAGARMAPKQEALGPRRDRSKGLVDSFRGLSPNTRIAVGVGIGVFAFLVLMVDEYVDSFNPATDTDAEAAAKAARELGIRVVDSDRK